MHWVTVVCSHNVVIVTLYVQRYCRRRMCSLNILVYINNLLGVRLGGFNMGIVTSLKGYGQTYF